MDAILKKTFLRSDFGKLLVCCKVHENLKESIEKPFVAIFWELNCILTGLNSEMLSESMFLTAHQHIKAI